MNHNRRQFLKSLLSGVAGATLANIDVDRLLWVPGEKTIFIPSAAQIRFLAADKVTLYGIPYHAHFSVGSWLGIPRESAYPEIIQMINALEKDKNG